MSKRVIWAVAILGGAILCAPARSQSDVGVVRVFTEPPGIYFTVDGQSFISQASFPWPANSKHIVTSSDQTQAIPGNRFAFKGWLTNLSAGSPSMSQPITAGNGLQWVKLVFDTLYEVTIQLVDCPDPAQPCPSAGRVEVNGDSFDRRTKIYLAPNATIEARAFPNAGYVFTGWAQITGLGAVPKAFVITFQLLGPTQLTPFFQPANSVQVQTNIQTIPPNLQVLVDRTPITGSAALEWGWGTIHSLGANPVQQDHGISYVFDSWSDGGAINHDVQVPSEPGTLNFTARFVPGSYVLFATSPAGLSLSIDGRQNWPNYSFEWAPGTIHKISAPATQTDAQGRKYRFVSWSNGKPAAFDYTTVAAPGGDVITANYQEVGQVTITSVPAGLAVEVDGAACSTPCALEREVGASVGVSVAAVQNTDDRSRLVFHGWSDSTALTRVIVLSSGSRTYTANYSQQHRLSVSVTPPEGASLAFTPSSPDGFYDAQSLVTVTLKLALGFRVNTWSGDFSGTSTGAAVSMDSPHSTLLVLDRVPAIGPAGIRNAAAGAISDGLAAGSLISIFGASLAPGLQVGVPSPLVQTLQGVTVRVDDTFLPLVFVSPQQINAQLPAALPEGSHKLILRWEGKPETVAAISVVRNAPGLFIGGTPDQPIGAVVRAGGQPVTADHPARANEVVSLLGTGFGPYAAMPPDGFLVDETGGYTLVDPVLVFAGETGIADILYAGRSDAGVGVDAIRFRVPATLPESPFLSVRIQIGGRDSNTVLLPISR